MDHIQPPHCKRATMESASLDEFMAWNDELYALAQAGVPLDVELGPQGTEMRGALERINALMARRVSQGASVAEALRSDNRVVTPAYAALIRLGLLSGSIDPALHESARRGEALEDCRQILRQSLVYPLILCCLAYAGIVAFCLVLIPSIESLHRELRLSPGWGLRLLMGLERSLPYWVALPPLMAVLLGSWTAFFRRPRLVNRRSTRALNWLPGMAAAIQQEDRAHVAETLATLLDTGTPLDEALTAAADSCAEPVMGDKLRSLAAAVNREQLGGNSSGGATLIPPFLRYALLQAEPAVGRTRALRMAASLYRDSAERQIQRTRLAAPLIACVVIGGGVTLLYALALFVPVIEMLSNLAM